MVLAAGLGQRMRPLTDERPKPMIAVNGAPMIDQLLDRLAEAGVEEAVVNLHHHAGQLRRHLEGRTRPRILFSEEETLLDTGGGVARALPQLGEAPFFVANGDVVWLDGPDPALRRLAEAWDPETMDALLLLQPGSGAFGYEGPGDFRMDPAGRLTRRAERKLAPFVYAGLHILAPRLFEDAPEGAFSLNLLWDKAAAAGRLFGLRHEGAWYHVGTPQALAAVERELALELGGWRDDTNGG
ncbi:MAG: nucleotidyltransferase family protein [Tistlia sp.]|uniref:nucleotidyltransferase family protein n=1 Tax=Tistlia sp. TaxID=3057121 RepID=UPI0034A4820D